MKNSAKFEGYSLEFVANISAKPVSKNGPISEKNYLELALEASEEFNEEFADEIFDKR